MTIGTAIVTAQNKWPFSGINGKIKTAWKLLENCRQVTYLAGAQARDKLSQINGAF